MDFVDKSALSTKSDRSKFCRFIRIIFSPESHSKLKIVFVNELYACFGIFEFLMTPISALLFRSLLW